MSERAVKVPTEATLRELAHLRIQSRQAADAHEAATKARCDACDAHSKAADDFDSAYRKHGDLSVEAAAAAYTLAQHEFLTADAFRAERIARVKSEEVQRKIEEFSVDNAIGKTAVYGG